MNARRIVAEWPALDEEVRDFTAQVREQVSSAAIGSRPLGLAAQAGQPLPHPQPQRSFVVRASACPGMPASAVQASEPRNALALSW